MGGQLLSLENVPQVKAALSRSMLGNVESDYRIDGWSAATWFEGENNSISEYVSVVPDMTSATLTMRMEDGSVGHTRHTEDRLGAVCQAVNPNKG